MTDTSQKNGGFSRRAVTIGGSIAAALGIAALGLSVPRWLGTNYAKSQYDDLFEKLVDRDAAVLVGERALGELGPGGAERLGSGAPMARELRDSLNGRTLAQVVAIELAGERVSEVGGWVLPTTLLSLCLLAALQEH